MLVYASNNYTEHSDVYQQQQLSNFQINQYFINHQASPYVRINEQPAKAESRFRYKCESRLASAIPGCNSTNDNKSFPEIEIVNYHGPAIIVVSCVTAKPPYMPHPHELVGKNCSQGVFEMEIQSGQTKCKFDSLGVRCIKKKDIIESLDLRESKGIDPFGTGFNHKKDPSSINMNVIRLCFEVYIQINGNRIKLQPVVSTPVYDKKSMANLEIIEMNPKNASASNQDEITVVCSRITKDNIQIRFYEVSEEQNGRLIWESFASLLPQKITKNSITFKVPKYRNENINHPVKCYVQLKQKTDNQLSEAKEFFYLPDDVYQPINSCLENYYSSRNQLNQNSFNMNLSNRFSNNLMVANNLVQNSMISSNLTQNLVNNNLANCLSTNLANDLSIQTYQQNQSINLKLQQSNSQNNHLNRILINSRKRFKSDFSSSDKNSMTIERKPMNQYLNNNNSIYSNNFYSNSAAKRPINLENLQRNIINQPNPMINNNSTVNQIKSSPIDTLANSVSMNNYSSNLTNQVTESKFIDLRNMYQSQQIKIDLNNNENEI